MKRKLVMLSLALTLVLTACSGKAATTDGNAEAQVEEQETQDTEESTEPEESTEKEEAQIEDVSSEDVQTDYIKGTLSETEYESEWLGLRFAAPEGFYLATEEELIELMGASMDILSDDLTEAQKKYAEMASVYELMCSSPDGVPNLNVISEKVVMKSLTIEDYIDAFKNQLSSITEMNVTLNDDVEVVQVAEKEFHKLSSVIDYEGMNMYQDYYLTKNGDRVISMTLTYTDDTVEQKDELLNAFSAMK